MSVQIVEKLKRWEDRRPSLNYRPGRLLDLDGNEIDSRDNGQLQFHMAPHAIRLLTPGNGFGKTGTLAVEAAWWGNGFHPYHQVLPDARPIKMAWCCQKFGQWDMMRADIEAWWPPSVVHSWNGQNHSYQFPQGVLHIITAEMDWESLQGIQPHILFSDERFPVALWRELSKRRRGKTRTRFCIAGTQTSGIQWEYHELYRPWLEFHQRRGMTEAQAMQAQLHRFDDPDLAELPGIWCWPKGGHYDNPTATRETWAFYRATTRGHPAEVAVRLHGGFRDFAGQPVFDPESLERMRVSLKPGRVGRFEEVQ